MSTLVVREIRERDEWNALVLALPDYDLRQGYEWGEVRSSQGWNPRRFAVFQGETCVAAVSILAKRIPVLGWSMLYAPGGPLLIDDKHEPAWDGLMDVIRSVAAQTRAVFLRVNPIVPNENASVQEGLGARGFQHLADDWTTWNSPRIVMTMDIREPLEALKPKLRKRYRENITSALKRGVTIRPAVSIEEGREFHTSLAGVGQRKGLPVRGDAYFEWLWKEYIRPGRGVLLLAEYERECVGGLLGAKLGQKAYMLYTTPRMQIWGEKLHHGPLLYWEFIRWAKEAGCETIDWGGSGTRFPAQEDDPGFGVYHFKLGFNSSLEYLTGYYDLVFSSSLYSGFRFLERWVAEAAWRFRAKMNGRFLQVKVLIHAAARKVRQFRISTAHRGLWTTLYWAAFGYLKPNRFVVFMRELSAGEINWVPREDIRIEMWEASTVRAWRENRQGLLPEFFQDEIDGVDTCAVVLVKGDVVGLIWIYRLEDNSRLFQLHDLEAELNHGCVLPKYRGMGLFKDLLLFSCRWLREQGYRRAYAMVHSTNVPSLQAFQRAGFRDVESVLHVGFFRPKYRGAVTRNEMSHGQDATGSAIKGGLP